MVYLYQQSKSPQHVYRGSVEECNKAHAGTCPQNHAEGRQAHDRRAAAALSGYLYAFPSVWVCEELSLTSQLAECSHTATVCASSKQNTIRKWLKFARLLPL